MCPPHHKKAATMHGFCYSMVMRWFLLIVMWMVSPAMAAEHLSPDPHPNITVLADESLMLPLADLTRDYAKRTHTPVTVVVKNTADAERQIGQGLEAHLVLTANRHLLDQITDQGSADVSSRHTIVRARLALVTTHRVRDSLNLAERISFAAILRATDALPVLATDETTPAGAQAKALLSGQEFSENLRQRLIVEPGTEELFDTLRDENALALVLATSSIGEPDIRILSLLPDSLIPAVHYEIVVLGSELMNESSAFAYYLTSRQAQAIWKHYGYQTD